MIRLISHAVVTLSLALLLLVSCSGCIAFPGKAGPMRITPSLPDYPSELTFMQTPSVLGLSKERAEERLGPGEFKPQDEAICSVPLVEENKTTREVTVTQIKGRILLYEFQHPFLGWTMKRMVCVFNDVVISELFEERRIVGFEFRKTTHVNYDVDLTRNVFWGEYDGHYRTDKLLEKKSKGPKYEL